jgi:hypothetical protein
MSKNIFDEALKEAQDFGAFVGYKIKIKGEKK